MLVVRQQGGEVNVLEIRLAGFAASGRDRKALSGFLDQIGYRYWEETDNPAYELFLR